MTGHEPHAHDDPHTHDDQHTHGHPHGHGHGGDFDWKSMAERLELDAAITDPIAREVVGELRATHHGPIARVLDVGCGPGAVACTLLEALPEAQLAALDSSPELLDRARIRAGARPELADRLVTLLGDLDHDLPPLAPVDLVWAGMVMHHVADPDATLRRLHAALASGGTLVIVEFGDVPRVLPEGDPLLRDGTWARFQAATTAALDERLGFDPVRVDWPALLTAAGFGDVRDTGRVAVHPAPLSPTARAWLVQHVRGGLAMAGDRLSAADRAALDTFADTVAHRDDLAVTAARRVLMSRR